MTINTHIIHIPLCVFIMDSNPCAENSNAQKERWWKFALMPRLQWAICKLALMLTTNSHIEPKNKKPLLFAWWRRLVMMQSRKELKTIPQRSSKKSLMQPCQFAISCDSKYSRIKVTQLLGKPLKSGFNCQGREEAAEKVKV